MLLKRIKQEPTVFLFSKFWKFAGKNKPKIVFYICLFVISNLASLVGPLIFAELLNEIQRNGIAESNLTYLLLIISSLLGMTFIFWLFHGFGRVIERRVAFSVEVAYKQYLMDGVLDLNLAWHGERDSGDTIDKVNKASRALFRFSSRVFLIMEILIKIIGTSAVLYFFNPAITLFVTPFIFLSFFILFQFDKVLVKQYRQLNKFDNTISAKIFDALSNVTSVIILNVQKSILRNIKKVLLVPKKLFYKNTALNEFKWFTGSILFDVIVVVPLAFYVLFVFKNNIAVEVGTISALYLYLSRLSDVFYTFSGFYEDLIVHKAAVQNAEPIEDSFVEKHVDKRKLSTWSTVAINDLQFTYEDIEDAAKHLENVSFMFKRGDKIALIGESGSGKTTFLKVLHGLYESAEAAITVDQRSLKTNFVDVDLHTTLVPQEPELFSASIRENITFGVDYPDEEIHQAMKLAQFEDVVNKLPHKLESVVNEKGVNLSGGQKQRLALARALLFVQDKDIILLDESTSSVDPVNEAKIYENIFETYEEKVIIASIHKMNLLKYFDHIVMFDKGSIVDQGTFNELLSRNAEFKRSWDDFIKSNN